MHSFKNRLLILIVALVTVAQGVTLLLALGSLRQSVREESELELVAARELLIKRLDERWDERRRFAAAVFRDSAFREALSSEDAPTIRTALDNQAARISADVGILYDADGHVIAANTADKTALSLELPVPGEARTAARYLVVDGKPHQLVMTELLAPQHVGWVALGFELSDASAAQLEKLAHAEIHFTTASESGATIAANGVPLQLTVNGDEYLQIRSGFAAANGRIELIVQRSMATAMSAFSALWKQMTVIVVAILLLAVMVGTIAGRSFIKPLAGLVSAAQRIARGSYDEPVDVRGGEEFLALGNTFNLMQEGIRERERLLYLQATRDALTGVTNRNALKAWLAQPGNDQDSQSLLMVDIHRFRDINASMGNNAGNSVLFMLARRLQQLAGPADACARLGADQFLVAMPLDSRDTEQAARSLVAELRAGVMLEGALLSLELRCGIASRHADVGADDFMRQAGVALLEAKEHDVEIVIFKRTHDVEHQRRVTLVADLRRAIANDGLTLAWQPLVQMTNREACMMEVLVRWTHPSLGEISPGEFVPLAERAAIVGELSKWVLKATIEQLGRWRRNGLELEAAVNLSASDMADPGLPMRVLLLLQQCAVPPSALLLEVTESTIMEEPVQAAAVMTQLRAAGVRFAIDDFGTGHSSLAQLTSLPVDELKIDRAFVRDLDRHTANQAIVRSTIELGHILGLKVVAEGIETPEVWGQLLRMGCDLAQGYFISRPMQVGAVPEWMATQRSRLSQALSAAEKAGQLTAIRPRSA